MFFLHRVSLFFACAFHRLVLPTGFPECAPCSGNPHDPSKSPPVYASLLPDYRYGMSKESVRFLGKDSRPVLKLDIFPVFGSMRQALQAMRFRGSRHG